MRTCCSFALFIAASYLVHPAFGGELPTAITRDTAAFSEDLFEKFRTEKDSDFGSIWKLFQSPQQWRYYSRDGGTLIAISVSQDLVRTERSAGEQAVAEVASRLIRQGGGETDVTVVFVEPSDLATLAPRPVQHLPRLIPAPVMPCGCR
jgi:hypothetical protein